jgi:hypothetical protein
MRTLEELKRKLESMRGHEHSYDEQEDGCPVCGDMDQIEHEIDLLITQGAE